MSHAGQPVTSAAEGEKIVIDQQLAFDILDVLRLTPVYALLSSDAEDQLGDDFKPEKWTGTEVEHAESATCAFRALLHTMQAQSDAR